MELDDQLAAAQVLATGPLVFKSIADAHPRLVAELKDLDPARTASTFAGLLALPELQSNCFRIEVLVHLAMAFCEGRSAPTTAFVRRSFERLGDGYCGKMEDPGEDVFVTLVNKSNGNFRIFEGIREGTGFYLQRILNIVEEMPHSAPWDQIRVPVDCLLRLSEEVAERTGVHENGLGQEMPLDSLPKPLADRLSFTRKLVRFSDEDLARLQIPQASLDEFIFRADDRSRTRLLTQRLGDTDLERRPLMVVERAVYLLLPTAVASAITRFVIESIVSMGQANVFVKKLADEFARLFAETPILGGRSRAPIQFQTISAGAIGAVMTEVDSGRFLHLVFFVDGLNGFDQDSLAGINPDTIDLSAAIRKHIELASKAVITQPGFRDGITLVVSCGFGRGAYFGIEGRCPQHWRLESIPAHDLITLSWVPDFRPVNLWSLLDARQATDRQGIRLFNMNGLLNLAAWARELDGHLVPQGQLPDDGMGRRGDKLLVVVRQNAVRDLRYGVLVRCDPRRILDADACWVKVRKLDESEFEEDNRAPLYASEEDALKGRLRAVYLARSRPWWIEVVPPAAPQGSVFDHWRMLSAWLQRAAPVLDEAYAGLPNGPVSTQIRFAEIVGVTDVVVAKDADELRSLLEIVAEVGCPIISIDVGAGFDDGLAQAENVAERALVEALVVGVATAAGEANDTSKRTALVEQICPNPQARWRHRIVANSFRDFVLAKREDPVLIHSLDDTAGRIGLAWRVHPREDDPEISGVSECKSCLNEVVRIVLDDLCAALKDFNRPMCVNALVQNLEAAGYDRETWKRTAQANIALHDDKNGAVGTIVDHLGRLNACFLASRILLEAAICECPLEGGRILGKLDLSRLMSKAMLAFILGGWSDAIHWGAMEPRLRISPSGDVQANQFFMETVFEPFGRDSGESQVRSAMASYTKLYAPAEVISSVAGLLESQFCAAWKAEFGISIDGARAFLERLHEFGLDPPKLILSLRRSVVIQMLAEIAGLSTEEASAALSMLILAPRPKWRVVSSEFKEKDWFPWRFRRRLSALRRPLIQIDDGDDPTIVLAPAMVQEALHAMMRWFHRGEIPSSQARSREMCEWLGHANNVQRVKFNSTVAERMRELGWQVEREIKLTKILGRSLDRDYGDIDVLAWCPNSGRVLAMECKDLQFHKSIGEVAEQLSDFRGEMRPDGKPDHLKRHLDRVELLASNIPAVSRALRITSRIQLEGHLVFKNPVPMQFAWDRMASRIRLSLYDQLDRL